MSRHSFQLQAAPFVHLIDKLHAPRHAGWIVVLGEHPRFLSLPVLGTHEIAVSGLIRHP